jgi:hypothetical protein
LALKAPDKIAVVAHELPDTFKDPEMFGPFCAIIPAIVVWNGNFDYVVEMLQPPAMFAGGMGVGLGVGAETEAEELPVMPHPCWSAKIPAIATNKNRASPLTEMLGTNWRALCSIRPTAIRGRCRPTHSARATARNSIAH